MIETSETPPSSRRSRGRVLVVEDDDDIRSSVEECLQSADFDAVGVANGEVALAWLEEQGSPSLIVLDLMMPVMDGFAFRVAQLADPRFAAVPLLVMTADGDAKRLSTELGLSFCVKKPCEPDVLVRAAERACGLPSLPSAASAKRTPRP
jgi:CheY-like chemotaxis protein